MRVKCIRTYDIEVTDLDQLCDIAREYDFDTYEDLIGGGHSPGSAAAMVISFAYDAGDVMNQVAMVETEVMRGI